MPTDANGTADSKIIVGLRKCGKHYLARNSFVPSDLPCEACIAATMASPALVVPPAYDQSSKNPEDNAQMAQVRVICCEVLSELHYPCNILRFVVNVV